MVLSLSNLLIILEVVSLEILIVSLILFSIVPGSIELTALAPGIRLIKLVALSIFGIRLTILPALPTAGPNTGSISNVASNG